MSLADRWTKWSLVAMVAGALGLAMPGCSGDSNGDGGESADAGGETADAGGDAAQDATAATFWYESTPSLPSDSTTQGFLLTSNADLEDYLAQVSQGSEGLEVSIAQPLDDDAFNNLDTAGGWLVLWDSEGSVAFVSPEDPSAIAHHTDLHDSVTEYIDALVYNPSVHKTFAVDAEQPSLVVVDHTGGEDAIESVDLSQYDEDGNPNASALWSDENFVLIGLSRSDEEGSNDAGRPAKVLVMDAASLEVTQVIDLPVTNVESGFSPFGDNLAVGVAGERDATPGDNVLDPKLDGGLFELTRNAAGDYALGETIVSEEELQGHVIDFSFTSTTGGIVAISPGLGIELAYFELAEGTPTAERFFDTHPRLQPNYCVSPDRSTFWLLTQQNAVGGENERALVYDAASFTQDGEVNHAGSRYVNDCVIVQP